MEKGEPRSCIPPSYQMVYRCLYEVFGGVSKSLQAFQKRVDIEQLCSSLALVRFGILVLVELLHSRSSGWKGRFWMKSVRVVIGKYLLKRDTALGQEVLEQSNKAPEERKIGE
jgi:hypothetical protein